VLWRPTPSERAGLMLRVWREPEVELDDPAIDDVRADLRLAEPYTGLDRLHEGLADRLLIAPARPSVESAPKPSLS
jgi:hypothetical protein